VVPVFWYLGGVTDSENWQTVEMDKNFVATFPTKDGRRRSTSEIRARRKILDSIKVEFDTKALNEWFAEISEPEA
jgi:hypothetical protein